MENRKKLIMMMSLAGAILLIFIGVVILKQEYKRDNLLNDSLPKVNQQKSSPVVIVEPQRDLEREATSTMAWTLYQNKDLGFEVEYPEEGYSIENGEGCFRGNKDGAVKHVTFWSSDFLKTHTVNEDQIRDFDIFINDPDDTCRRNNHSFISGPSGERPRFIDSKKVRVGAYSVLKRNYSYLAPDGNPDGNTLTTWRFEKNRVYYTLLFKNGVTVDAEKEYPIFEKFLNSFRLY